jgi:hypothetical protein
VCTTAASVADKHMLPDLLESVIRTAEVLLSAALAWTNT